LLFNVFMGLGGKVGGTSGKCRHLIRLYYLSIKKEYVFLKKITVISEKPWGILRLALKTLPSGHFPDCSCTLQGLSQVRSSKQQLLAHTSTVQNQRI
jgi:hypothetical protein